MMVSRGGAGRRAGGMKTHIREDHPGLFQEDHHSFPFRSSSLHWDVSRDPARRTISHAKGIALGDPTLIYRSARSHCASEDMRQKKAVHSDKKKNAPIVHVFSRNVN